ncbi:MAG: CAP domain-containing protein, partial [Acidimicrobiia bacterium]
MKRALRLTISSLLVALAIGVMGQTAQAAPSASDAEVEFLQRLNSERTSRGLVALTRDPGLDAVADDWSGRMASVNVLSHRPDLSTRIAAVEPRWTRGGENVGYGGDVLGLHNAFMNSPGHYANVVGDWNRIGVGVVVKGSTIWVTFNFLKGPPLATTTSASTSGASASFSDPGKVWVVTDNGEVHSLGGAPFYGDLRDLALVKPIVGMTPTPTGLGYWMVASDGGIFAFGDAAFYGSTGGTKLVAPIVAMTATPTGKGYWLVASDGGVFA